MGVLLGLANAALAYVVTPTAVGAQIFAAVFAIIYLVADVLGRALPVPTRHWLVPQRWALYGPARWSLLFGLSLGAGLLTVIPFIGFHLFVFSGALFLTPSQALLTYFLFGVGRAASTVSQLLTAYRTAQLVVTDRTRPRSALSAGLSRVVIPLLRISALVAFAVIIIRGE